MNCKKVRFQDNYFPIAHISKKERQGGGLILLSPVADRWRVEKQEDCGTQLAVLAG